MLWIGLNDRTTEGVLAWHHGPGTERQVVPGSDYTNGINHGAGDNKDCVSMDSTSGSWSHRFCHWNNVRAPTICEGDPV